MDLQTWTYSSVKSTCSFQKEQVVFPLCKSHYSSSYFFVFFFLVVISLSSCCSKTDHHNITISYTTPAVGELSELQPPAFHILSGNHSFNKIGTPEPVEVDGEPDLQVNSRVASLYFEQDHFTTKKGTYTNRIYRLHFPEVPFGLCSFNITTGKNPGLLIIYTLDQHDRLVLITTVHTCGCYLAFFPTTDLPEDAFPRDWPKAIQSVFGYKLPGIVPSQTWSDKPYTFTLASETHRVIGVSKPRRYQADITQVRPLNLHPMTELNNLLYQDETLSFFETEGSREGYVKNNSKPLERLLISWWAFDWHVGEDKAYGKSDTSTTRFYTSLKFWQRDNSDMKNFPRFLSYWGWNL